MRYQLILQGSKKEIMIKHKYINSTCLTSAGDCVIKMEYEKSFMIHNGQLNEWIKYDAFLPPGFSKQAVSSVCVHPDCSMFHGIKLDFLNEWDVFSGISYYLKC